MECHNSVRDFYSGKHVFITGATGFMGKVLVEKLLRSCPGIHKIYILVRAKKGQDPTQRVNAILDCKIFDKLQRHQPDFREKVVPICGDIMDPKLGLSESDASRLISEVSIVFHCAATVRFDESLKLSLQMNVCGTKKVLELCQKMQKLEALLHVSTAYANCDRNRVTEKVYPLTVKPTELLAASDWMDEEVIDLMTPSLVKPRPNTYTFTKALAENYLAENKASVPCAIVRPSIVGASFAEPYPGWVDNFNGPTGVLAAIGKGFLRCLKGEPSAVADIIPVDIATNVIIAAAWHTAIQKPKKMMIYNTTTGQINPLTWGMIELASPKYFSKHPLDGVLRVPNVQMTPNSLWLDLNVWFDHYLPAWGLDLGLMLTGKRAKMVNVQNKIQNSLSHLAFFTSNEWIFSNDNVMMLNDSLNPDERKIFNCDVSKIDWEKYLENYCIGIKLYALKEDMLKLPAAKQSLERIHLINRMISMVMMFILLTFSLKRSQMLTPVWSYALSLIVRTKRSKLP